MSQIVESRFQRLGSPELTAPSDALFARALAGLNVGLVIVRDAERVAWLNNRAVRFLGLPASDSVGRPLGTLIKDVQLLKFWHEATDANQPHDADVALTWPERISLKAHAAPFEEDGEPGWVVMLSDVTAERKVQLELSQAVANRFLALTSGHMPPEPVANLTHQELRVLRMVGGGMGNDEIAVKMSISASTVRSHLKSLYRKLSIASRAEAVSYAVRNNLV